MPYRLSVELEIPEPRVNKEALYVSAGGMEDPRLGWDLNRSAGVWREPLTGMIIQQPKPVKDDWATTTTGAYARLAKADYTLTTSAAWVENHRELAGNIYLEGLGTNEQVETASSYPDDQPWYFSVFVPGIQKLGAQTVLEFGWGTGGSSLSFRLRANGQLAIYDGSDLIETGTLAYQAAAYGVAKSLNLQTINFMVLPIRPLRAGAESDEGMIVIATDQGGGHVLRLADLGTDPILPSATLWWQVPIGKPSVQVAKVNFDTQGILWGPLRSLRYAPASGRTWAARAFESSIGPSSGGATTTYQLYRADRTTVFSPDGTLDQCVPRVQLDSLGGATLAIEAFDLEFSPTTTTTYDDPIEIRDKVSVSFKVDEEGTGTAQISGLRGALEDLGVDRPHLIGHRPFGLSLVDIDTDERFYFMRGTLMPSHTPAEGGTGDVVADEVVWEGQDRSAILMQHRPVEGLPFDDELVSDALGWLVSRAGFTVADHTAISTSALRVAPSTGIALGKWARLPERGESIQEILNKFKDDYLTDWWGGWGPSGVGDDPGGGVLWRMVSPDDLPTTPAITIYEKDTDALAASVPAASLSQHLLQRIERHPVMAEANQTIMVTQNPRDGRIYFGQFDDTASQAPGTAPASRSEDWAGQTIRVISVDPLIETQANADYFADLLGARLAAARHLADLHCRLLVVDGSLLWNTQIIRLVLNGGTDYEDFRILALEATFEQGYDDTLLTAGRTEVWSAVYRCERIGEGTLP